MCKRHVMKGAFAQEGAAEIIFDISTVFVKLDENLAISAVFRKKVNENFKNSV